MCKASTDTNDHMTLSGLIHKDNLRGTTKQPNVIKSTGRAGEWRKDRKERKKRIKPDKTLCLLHSGDLLPWR